MKQQKKPQKQPVTNDYQSLKTVWYAKLKKSGFKDAEKNEHRLKQWSSKFKAPNIRNSWDSKHEYYSMARQFLNNYKFESNLEKAIWEYHVEGISYRNIAKLLKKVKTSITPNKDNINTIVNLLEIEMKIMLMPGFIPPNE